MYYETNKSVWETKLQDICQWSLPVHQDTHQTQTSLTPSFQNRAGSTHTKMRTSLIHRSLQAYTVYTHTHTHTVMSDGDSEESQNDCYFCLISTSSSPNPPLSLLVPLKSSVSVFNPLFYFSFLSSLLRHFGSPC